MNKLNKSVDTNLGELEDSAIAMLIAEDSMQSSTVGLQNPHHEELRGKKPRIKYEHNTTLNAFTKDKNYDMALHIASEAMP